MECRAGQGLGSVNRDVTEKSGLEGANVYLHSSMGMCFHSLGLFHRHTTAIRPLGKPCSLNRKVYWTGLVFPLCPSCVLNASVYAYYIILYYNIHFCMYKLPLVHAIYVNMSVWLKRPFSLTVAGLFFEEICSVVVLTCSEVKALSTSVYGSTHGADSVVERSHVLTRPPLRDCNQDVNVAAGGFKSKNQPLGVILSERLTEEMCYSFFCYCPIAKLYPPNDCD